MATKVSLVGWGWEFVPRCTPYCASFSLLIFCEPCGLFMAASLCITAGLPRRLRDACVCGSREPAAAAPGGGPRHVPGAGRALRARWSALSGQLVA